MRRMALIVGMLALMLLVFGMAAPVMAQSGETTGKEPQLVVFTSYPSQVIGTDENVDVDVKLRVNSFAQVVRLEMAEIPEGWTATFRGGGKVVKAVYVEPDRDASVTLKLEPPEDVAASTYKFVVRARGEGTVVDLPLEVTVQEKVPPSLTFEVELPTLTGKPNTTFRYNATLKNEGDEDVTVQLQADAPPGFEVTFKLTGQEVTSLPLEANQSKRLTIEAQPYVDLAAGAYPIAVRARGGEAEASLSLTAEVTGQPELQITAPDGRLSGRAYAGQETPLKIIVQNTGTAPARGVEMSSSEPAGWSVEFDPEKIDEIKVNEQVELTAKVRPADKAVAGDYMLTIRARPEDGATRSAEFRITVMTSTLWGVVGVGLIAVAVAVVGLAVMRFGRR